MKLVWTAPAIGDRRAIYDYVDAENPRAAAELDEQFERAANLLRTHPEMGRPGRIAGTRELIVRRRYFLLYEISDNMVAILAVVHTSRLWPPVSHS